MKIGKQEMELLYNGAAMYAMRDVFGPDFALVDAVAPDTREAFSTACTAAAIMAEQAELYRRYLGYDARPIITAREIEVIIKPYQIPQMKSDIVDAMIAGLSREHDPEEIDLGLLELMKKKDNS